MNFWCVLDFDLRVHRVLKHVVQLINACMFNVWIKGILNACLIMGNIFCRIGRLLHVKDMGMGQLIKFSSFCLVAFNALASFFIYY